MSFFYLPQCRAAASRFWRQAGLLGLAFVCGALPLQATAAPSAPEPDQVAISDMPAAPPGFYAWAAFMLAGRWLCIPVSQDTVAVWSPAGGGKGRWSRYEFCFELPLDTIKAIHAWTASGELDHMPEAEAVRAALAGSQIWMGQLAENGFAIENYLVYNVQQRKHFLFPWMCITGNLKASCVWLEGGAPWLLLPGYSGNAPSGATFQVCPNEESQRTVQLGPGNVVLTGNPDRDANGRSFYACRVKTSDTGIKKEKIAIIPGRLEGEAHLFKKNQADASLPPHLKGEVVTVARTVVAGVECLLSLVKSDVDGAAVKVECHLYISPKGSPEQPDQIICLASRLSFMDTISLFHLGPHGLLYCVNRKNRAIAKVWGKQPLCNDPHPSSPNASLCFHEFWPGARGLYLLASGYARHCLKGEELPTDLLGRLVEFCLPLPPEGMHEGIPIDPTPEQRLKFLSVERPLSAKKQAQIAAS